MGDRGNIVIRQHGNEGDGKLIYVYTHWHGYKLPKLLQDALKRKERWADESYLTRIIVSEIIKAVGINDPTGCGISTYLCDNEYPLLVVDSEEGTVSVWNEDLEVEFAKLTFDEYCELVAPESWREEVIPH